MPKAQARRVLLTLGVIMALAAVVWIVICWQHSGASWTSIPAIIYSVVTMVCFGTAWDLR